MVMNGERPRLHPELGSTLRNPSCGGVVFPVRCRRLAGVLTFVNEAPFIRRLTKE